MIDPIGLVGTLIAIIHVCNKVVTVCYDYRTGVRDAPQEISRILNEVSSVRSVAQRLLQVAETDQTGALPSLQAMTSDDGTLSKCLTELVDLKTSLKLGKRSALKSAFVWPLKRSEAERKLQSIGQMKETLQLALSADTAENMVEVLAHTRSLPSIQAQVSSLHSFVGNSEEYNQRITLLRWLDGRNQSAKHLQEFQKCVKGTGDWLLHMDIYIEWKTNHGRLLWLNGNAGCGKSVLCAKVIEHLRVYCQGLERASLSYFYIDGSDPRSLSMNCLYRSLISQLVAQKERLPWSMKQLLYESESESAGLISTSRWMGEFQNLLESYDRNYIVLDALDEWEGHTQLSLDELSEFIEQVKAQVGRSVNLIAFSRDLEQLRNTFKSCGAEIIEIDDKALSLDMQTALRYRLSCPPKFAKWPQSLKNTIETSLLGQANGSFRWLDCQLGALRKCATPAAVRKVLADLPTSLEAYYTRALESIDESNRPSVKSLLRWVCFAFRPLSLAEISNAIAINADDIEMPFLDESLELLDPDGFMDSCSSLISKYYDTDPTGDLDVYVKLSHFTVREFLVSGALRNGPYAEFAFNANLANSCLARSCLVYFHEAVQSITDVVWVHKPLARYAGHYWPRHHQLAGQFGISGELQDVLFDLFDEEKPYYQTWLEVANVDRPWLGEELDKSSSNYAPLYCAVYYNFPDVVKALLDKGMSPNYSSGLYGSPLQVAALHGHLESVNTLLSAGADLNAETGRYGTALGAAAAKGHIEVVMKLLESGASVDRPKAWSHGGRRSDPLYLAVKNEQLSVCKILLEHGAKDFHHFKGDPPSALHVAVQTGRLDIIKALLAHERIRDANSHERGCSALIRSVQSGVSASQYSAAALGHVDILRELLPYGISKEETLRYAARAGDKTLVLEYLDQGVGIDSEGHCSDHPRALQSAAEGGHVDVVRELLSRGADPSMISGYSTAIEAAIEAGSIEIVQMLIDAGADVNARFALQNAISTGRKDLVELLVRHGQDAQRELSYCARNGRFQDFKLLLELGADVNRQSPDEETSLLVAAVFGGSIDIVQYLLNNGLQYQLNPGPTEMNPLTGAILARHWPLVKPLLEHGADVNLSPPAQIKAPGAYSSYDGYSLPPHPVYETPLTLAVNRQNPEIAHLLMNQGAMVTPDTPVTAGTPLIYGACEGFTDLFKDLLHRGADPTQRGTILKRAKPTFPLLVAAEKGHIEIINCLIDAGVPVNDQDSEGFAALHVAAAGKNPEVLQVLIQKHHADMNVRLLNGSQPIHSAASKGNPQHLDILLDAGASINAKNGTGMTPLHWAAESGNWDNVEKLLDRGAAANIKADEDGALTPFDIANLTKRQMSKWKRGENVSTGWDDGRLEKLLQRLKEAASSIA